MKALSLAALAALAALPPASADAAILSGSVTGGTVFSTTPAGSFVQLDPTAGGFAVGHDNFNTNNLYGFNELQNVQLSSALLTNLGVTSIAAGTWVSSHVIFFDPLANQTVKGTLTFDAPILGVITLRSNLVASNFLGSPNVTYNMPGSVGLEPGIDFVQLGTPGPNDLKIVQFDADTPGDLFRVITAGTAPVVSSAPEPSTWATMVTGFGFIGLALRRRTRTKLA